jgi:hypothetical protein
VPIFLRWSPRASKIPEEVFLMSLQGTFQCNLCSELVPGVEHC